MCQAEHFNSAHSRRYRSELILKSSRKCEHDLRY